VECEALARDDKTGRLLQDQALPVRRRRRIASARAGANTQGARAMTDVVEVWLDAHFLEHTRVGTLSHDRGTLRCVYEPAWLENPQAFARREALAAKAEGRDLLRTSS
jgi:hypothetical protein